ncbi:MAG: thiol reductase thioredoxin [Prolixibacteraceae bacterium]|nr:thiol reductase thioredoxin [Prolixibacteraceae bacterium]
MKQIIAILFVMASFSVFAVNPAEKSSESKAAININKADFIANVMDYENNTQEWVFKGDKPCLIDFYADWCGPCRITSPILEELAQEYKGKIDVYKVDVDQERELAQVFGVSGIPAFLYCPMEGKPTMTSGIAKDKEQTKEMFRNYIETILLENK